MRVDIEKIQKLKKELREFNKLPLEKMVFYKKGKKVDVPKNKIEKWNLIGLNNSDFIETEFWKEDKDE